MEFKKCSKCGDLKEQCKFTRIKKAQSGLSSACKDCDNRDRRLARTSNQEEFNKKRKDYRSANKDRIKAEKQRSYLRNRIKIIDKQKKYQEANRERFLKYQRNQYELNRGTYIARARVRAGRLASAPIHFMFRERCRELYNVCIALSKEHNLKHHVDHIIPLNHPEICGLNVPWNLQILSEAENRRKKNKFDGTVDNLGWMED
jgi:5-methylcytosine-specific restriction endonuclease McrA